ncbi:MAG: hypothetical protein OEY97_13405 [Nitrospirota bacterium]|nr:hypothetical protein [Nitrospirota bacterium]
MVNKVETRRSKLAFALAAVAVLGFGAYAWAADLNIVNNTESYADPLEAAKFIVTPSDCAASPANPIDNSPTGACRALGDLALQAIQGTGPMNYWQGNNTTDLRASNFFVPSDLLWNYGHGGGIAPIFSKNSRTLFGSGSEMLGMLTREEMLLLTLKYPGETDSLTQSDPANASEFRLLAAMLTHTEGQPSITISGITFNWADIPTITRLVGGAFTLTGKATTIYNNCLLSFPIIPLPGPPWTLDQCLAAGPDFMVTIYLLDMGVVNPDLYGAFPGSCGPGDYYCTAREQWIDQTVVGYVTSLDKDTGAKELTQNFRSQITFEPVTPIGPDLLTYVDQRLEQSVELGQAQFTAERQTFQQAFQVQSRLVAFQNPVSLQWGQLVSQDVEGYLFTCVNCDTPELIASGGSHAFDPYVTTDQITFIPYTSQWHSVPSIVHAPN